MKVNQERIKVGTLLTPQDAVYTQLFKIMHCCDLVTYIRRDILYLDCHFIILYNAFNCVLIKRGVPDYVSRHLTQSIMAMKKRRIIRM